MFLLIQSKYDNQDPLIFNEKGPVLDIRERTPFFSIISNTLTCRPCIKRDNLRGHKKEIDGILYSACKYLSEIHDSIGRRIPFVFVLKDSESSQAIQTLMQFVSEEYKLSEDDLMSIKECLTDIQHKFNVLFFLTGWIKKLLKFLGRR